MTGNDEERGGLGQDTGRILTHTFFVFQSVWIGF